MCVYIHVYIYGGHTSKLYFSLCRHRGWVSSPPSSPHLQHSIYANILLQPVTGCSVRFCALSFVYLSLRVLKTLEVTDLGG